MNLIHEGSIGYSPALVMDYTSTDSIAVTLTAGVAVGHLVVVRLGNAHRSDHVGETNDHLTMVDTAGNVYAKIAEVSQPQPYDWDRGATVSMWITTVTTALLAGHVVTAGMSAAVPRRIMTVDAYAPEDLAATVTVAGYAVGHATSNTITATLDLGEPAVHTWIAAGYLSDSGYHPTMDPLFETDRPAIVEVDYPQIWGQFRNLNTGVITYTATIPGDWYWGLVLIALTITPLPEVATAGNREFRADFETAGHQLEDTTTDRRVDAVSFDYRIAYTTGPSAIEVAIGLESNLWRARADGNDVYLARDEGEGWGDEMLLTTMPGTGTGAITELDVAFNEAGKPVLVAERDANVWLYFFNDHYLIDRYTWQWIGPGTSPRCCNDYFPPEKLAPNVCPPEIDVQMVFMKPSVGMVRREESDRFVADNPTPIAWSAGHRVQRLFRTVDHRVSAFGSHHDVTTGRYESWRVDSMPFPDSLLARPTFLNWSSPSGDVMQALSNAARGPTATEGFILRVQTHDTVDTIEVAATGDLNNGDFDQQVQEFSSPYDLGAGGWHDFTFSVDVGGGNLSLRAFRARTKRTIGEVTCYSPWRYTVIPLNAGDASGVNDLWINCSRDMLLDVANRLAGFVEHGFVEGLRDSEFSAASDNWWPGPCEEYPYITSAPPGYWFVGGTRNYGAGYPNPMYFTRFSFRRRSWARYTFTDDSGTYAGVVVGDVFEGGAGGSPAKQYDWPANRFPRQVPDDTGLMPIIPLSLDVIGSV